MVALELGGHPAPAQTSGEISLRVQTLVEGGDRANGAITRATVTPRRGVMVDRLVTPWGFFQVISTGGLDRDTSSPDGRLGDCYACGYGSVQILYPFDGGRPQVISVSVPDMAAREGAEECLNQAVRGMARKPPHVVRGGKRFAALTAAFNRCVSRLEGGS